MKLYTTPADTVNTGVQAHSKAPNAPDSSNTAFFDNIPGGLYYSALPSAGNPLSQTISIRNEGSGQLQWNAIPTTADSGNWLTLSATSGTAPSTLAIGIIAQNLPGQGTVAGTYTGQVLLQSANGSVTVPVTVVIGSTGLVQSNGLVFNSPAGPLSQSINIGQIDGGSANEVSSVFTGNGGNWLSISLTGDINTPRAFTLSVTPSLPAGTYTGEATFVGYYGAPGQTVQVTLNVIGKPPASITPVSGTPQSAVVNTSFANPLVAIVKDAAGIVVPGVSVAFTAPASSAGGSFAGQTSVTVVTDSSGMATSPAFTANATPGTYAVTAAVAGLAQTALFSLTNTRPPLTSIAITAANNTVAIGGTDQFTAIGTYSDGSTANITSQAAWNSSAAATASINASGLAAALAQGTTNITASLNGVTSNSFLLTVTRPTGPTVLSYSVIFGSQSYNLVGTTRNRLPWQITGIRVVFSDLITAANLNSLTGLAATGFSGLGTNTLTWTFNPVVSGLFTTALSGTGPNAITAASGSTLNNGAGFAQAIKVLAGDFNDDGYVTSADMVGVNNATAAPYNLFADINGDGAVNLLDVQTVRARLGASQP